MSGGVWKKVTALSVSPRAVAFLSVPIVALVVSLAASGAPPVSSSTRIAAGRGHTCALTSGGGVKCWGQNVYGQLGHRGRTEIDDNPNPIPVAVTRLTSWARAISAGSEHSCALTRGGGVKCWGYNGYGQLGHGTGPDSSTPITVRGLARGVSAISAGSSHTCALTSRGGVKCWGLNNAGQLGSESALHQPTPVAVDGLATGVAAIAAGGLHTCALMNGGGVKCWGWNYFGQVGNGSRDEDILSPVDVAGLATGVKAISAGYRHTCALTSAGGGVRCWGLNEDGQLGDDSTTDSRTPVGVYELASGVTAISAGYGHTCAVTSRGGVKCWGSNRWGQLGNGASRTISDFPVDVTGLGSGVSAVSAGSSHTCAITSGGGVKCWGYNGEGQLGNDSTTNSSTPVDVVRFISQTIALHPSKPAGSIARGRTVTFTATVRPLEPAPARATVRFDVYRRVNGVWRRAFQRIVTADASGRVTFSWTFSRVGSWDVRAKALANATYAASAWSPSKRYTVR
jgi:alpha-tubulin suppressor-like RCC1 family protein